MLEKLNLLKDLQKVDDRLLKIENSKGELPELVVDIKKQVEDKKEDISNLNLQINEVLDGIKSQAVILLDAESFLDKSKVRRSNVTNNKEYEALINEIAHNEDSIEKANDEKTKLEQENSDLESLNETDNDFLKQLEEKLENSVKSLEEKLSATKDEELELGKKREKIVKKLNKQLYGLYKRIFDSKGKKAVVSGAEGFCGGCFTVLPSQKLSELKRMDSLVQCDACNRILTYEAKDESQA